MQLFKRISLTLRHDVRSGAVGSAITGFTIFSHFDSFVSLSKYVQFLTEAWRDIIALPWSILALIFEFQISKTFAGLLTVLIATALVIYSSLQESRAVLTRKKRFSGIAVCSIIGFLYSALVIVPALFDERKTEFAVTSMSIEILADIFYKNLDTVDTDIIHQIITTILIFGVYVLALIWPLNRSISLKSPIRTGLGAVLIILFLGAMGDFFTEGYLPISLAGESLLELAVMLFVMLLIICGPYLASVYLSDPALILRRNFTIAIILAALFVLDRCAVALEWIAGILVV